MHRFLSIARRAVFFNVFCRKSKKQELQMRGKINTGWHLPDFLIFSFIFFEARFKIKTFFAKVSSPPPFFRRNVRLFRSLDKHFSLVRTFFCPKVLHFPKKFVMIESIKYFT